jgi:hypothetical protein
MTDHVACPHRYPNWKQAGASGIAAGIMAGLLVFTATQPAFAQSAGSSCSKVGTTSPDGSLVCRKVKIGKKTALRWRSASKAPVTLSKGPSDPSCLNGMWTEDAASLQSFIRQMAPAVPATVNGSLSYLFANGVFTASGAAGIVGASPAAAIVGNVVPVTKPFPFTYDGIALSMQVAADGDYPRFFDVQLTVDAQPVGIKTGNPGGPAFFPLQCQGPLAQLSVQTPTGVATRTLRRVAKS